MYYREKAQKLHSGAFEYSLRNLQKSSPQIMLNLTAMRGLKMDI